MLLDELELPYTVRELELTETKSEEYVRVNPNNHLPIANDRGSKHKSDFVEGQSLDITLISMFHGLTASVGSDSPVRY